MSESEEMYLITIAGLSESESDGVVPLSQLATELAVQPVSANQMIRKLDEAGLVSYIPYKGVELTPEGRQEAMQVLRHRRLWEVFLVDHLGLSLEDADALACKMEHITPFEVAKRLSNFLGNPVVSPQGKHIPQQEGGVFGVAIQSLNHLQVGQTSLLVHMGVNAVTQDFLNSEGVHPGVMITIAGVGGGGNLLVRSNENVVNITPDIAKMLFVEIPEASGENSV
jgi:DtxR family Mn-dependent transcriptional regulator